MERGDTMTKEERHTYWKNLVDEQAQSGLNAPAFCSEHNLKLDQFYRWRRRFKNHPGKRSPNEFMELIPSSKASCSGIRIRLLQDLSIEVERGFDPVTLQAVIQALSS
jgi:transposase-like protein